MAAPAKATPAAVACGIRHTSMYCHVVCVICVQLWDIRFGFHVVSHVYAESSSSCSGIVLWIVTVVPVGIRCARYCVLDSFYWYRSWMFGSSPWQDAGVCVVRCVYVPSAEYEYTIIRCCRG